MRGRAINVGFFSLPRYITHILYKSIAVDRIVELNSSRINEMCTYLYKVRTYRPYGTILLQPSPTSSAAAVAAGLNGTVLLFHCSVLILLLLFRLLYILLL